MALGKRLDPPRDHWHPALVKARRLAAHHAARAAAMGSHTQLLIEYRFLVGMEPGDELLVQYCPLSREDLARKLRLRRKKDAEYLDWVWAVYRETFVSLVRQAILDRLQGC